VISSLGEDLRTIRAAATPRRRRELLLLAVLMPVTALVETAMVASLVPFIALLTGQAAGTLVFDDLMRLVGWLGMPNPLLEAAIAFGLFAVLTAALRLALSWTSQEFAFGLGHELSVEIQQRLLAQPYSFHLQRHSSEQLSALEKVDSVIFNLILPGVQAAGGLLISLFVIALLISIDPLSAGLTMLLLGAFYGLVLLVARPRFDRHARDINSAYEQRLRAVQESVGGIRDLILDRTQAMALERFATIDRRFMIARAWTAHFIVAPRFVVEAFGMILIAALAILISGRSGGISAALPILAALALAAQRLLPLGNQLYGAWAGLASSRPILTDIVQLLRLPLDEDCQPVVAISLKTSIELVDVGFHYSGRAEPALERISLSVPKGSRIAITGRTGSGKSTLADLLMGLIEPTEGRVLVDGVELDSRHLIGWRKSIAHVPQEIFLADDSIAANIALAFHGGTMDQERVRRAAAIAQLDEFIASLPDGYDTRVGERGVLLSGGQRQRLALARAIYKEASLLVLDEATSALDERTEAAVIDALDKLQTAGCTIVIIAHRPSTVKRCDPIFVLEEGRLVQSGRYDQLFGQLARLHEQAEP
jgi:ABC-type multidrug transport system fused ATPase/permease subunit